MLTTRSIALCAILPEQRRHVMGRQARRLLPSYLALSPSPPSTDPLTSFPERDGWDRLLALNIKSMFYLTVGALPLLEAAAVQGDPSRVINVSSMASVGPQAEGPLSAEGSGTWSYQPSKAGANHLT